MVMKSKKSGFRKAIRLAPVLASLSALAMVAACARTNGNKTPISAEKREKAAKVVNAKLFKDHNESDAANLEFASHFKGASIVIHGRDKKNIQATIKMMFDDHADPVIVTGLLPLGKDVNEVRDMANLNPAVKTDITVKAGCGGIDCAVVSAEMTLTKELIEAAAAPAGAQGSANIAAALKPSEPTSSQVASIQAADPTPSSPEGAAPAAAPAEEPAAPAPEKKMLIAKNVIAFTITAASATGEETEAQKTERLSKMTLMTSGRTTTGEGSTASFEDAYQAIKGEPAPAIGEVEVLTEQPEAKTPAQPAPPERAEDPAAGPETSADADADAEPAPATAPAAAAPTAAAPAAAAPATAAPAPAAPKTAAPAAAPAAAQPAAAAVPPKTTSPATPAARTAAAPASAAAAAPAAARTAATK